MDKTHECSQGATLATICEKLENIEKVIVKIESTQKEYISEQKEIHEDINGIKIDSAKYPTSETLNGYLKKVDHHDTILVIIAGALVFVATWLSGILRTFFFKGT